MKIKNKSLQTWAKLLPFLAPYKWQMILIIALMILGACFDMVQPLFSGYAVDNFIEPRTTEGLIPFTAVYLSMVVVQTITTILMAIYALKVEMYLGRDLKRKLFDHLQTLDFSYYNTTPVGTIMARLMSDTGKIGTVLAWSLVDIFWSSMYVLGCVVIMLFVNWKLALILIAIIPIIAVITVVFQKKILAVNRRVRAINAEVTRHYNEGISGAKTSKTLVIEEKNDKAFEKVAEDMRSTTIRAVRLNAVYIPIISFLTAIGVAMVLNQGGNMVLFGDITVGEMTVFINYALIIADPVQQLARTISNFISTQVNIERVSALLEREPLIKDTPEVIEKYGTAFDPKRENWEPIQGHITFDDVTFRYPDGVENVLEHFSLDIPAGTTVAIVGETGAGKSTLVKLLAFFAAEQRRTGTAGIVRVAKREAGIQRSSEQCRFAEARMPAHNGLCAVQPLVVLGVIHAAHRRPRPQCDFTRVMRRAFAVFIQNTRKAGGEVAVVARHILIAERKHRKAVVDELLRRHVAVRHIASEIDVDKKRVRPLCGRHSQIHREREIFAVYHNAKRQLFQRRLARAEIIRNAGLRFPNERSGRGYNHRSRRRVHSSSGTAACPSSSRWSGSAWWHTRSRYSQGRPRRAGSLPPVRAQSRHRASRSK